MPEADQKMMMGILEVLVREVMNPASTKETREAAHTCLEVKSHPVFELWYPMKLPSVFHLRYPMHSGLHGFMCCMAHAELYIYLHLFIECHWKMSILDPAKPGLHNA